MKQLHLPVGSRGTLAADLTLDLIVKLQHNILQPISHDRLSEHITPILIGVIHYFEPGRQSGSHPFVYLRNGIFLQKLKTRAPAEIRPPRAGREKAPNLTEKSADASSNINTLPGSKSTIVLSCKGPRRRSTVTWA